MTARSEIVIGWRNVWAVYEQEVDWVIKHMDGV